MKKFLLFALTTVFLFALFGCSFEICFHEYITDSVTKEPTCSEEGYGIQVCKHCEKQREHSLPALEHEYSYEEFEPTCENDGYKLATCKNCVHTEKTDIIPAAGHNFESWVTVTEASSVNNGLKERECLNCGYTEKSIIASIYYIDLSVIKADFIEGKRYDAASYDELLLLFRAAIFNMAGTLECNVTYQFGDFKALLDTLTNDSNTGFYFKAEASVRESYSKKLIRFNFTYRDEPDKKSTTVYYTQYGSLNYTPPTQSRPSNYDDFKINQSLYTFNVKTTDQLFYALEHGAKPICAEGSTAQRAYDELKRILISIINDEMTDLEKIRAIHDYLVMNVTYDNELYSRINESYDEIIRYNGFYLEGVLFDKVAVCEGISKAFTSLCNMEGIPCVTVTGFQTENPNGAGHAWNKVFADGCWYIADATSDGIIANNSFEILSYKYFLISEEDYSKLYTAENFLNIECNDTYDIYESTEFTYDESTYDFSVSSQAELNALVAYFKSFGQKNSSIEFKWGFNYGPSFTDELSKAFQSVEANYNYINNGDCLILLQ